MDTYLKLAARVVTVFLLSIICYGCSGAGSSTVNDQLPTVETMEIINIERSSAEAHGKVTKSGSLPIDERGIAWDTLSTPEIDSNFQQASSVTVTGKFSATLSNLEDSTKYYVRAYAKTSEGISYGNEVSFITKAQNTHSKVENVVYKTVNDTTGLAIHFRYPDDYSAKEQWPVIVFFHGGGWNGGSWSQFLPQAKHFSKNGFICALPEYRLANKHGSTPFESLQDAKSAVRYLRAHSEQFNIDTTQVILSGGSAGGHLAAAVHMVNGYNDPEGNVEISTKGDALALFNPVLDNGPNGYGYNRVGEQYKTFSPYHQPKEGTPPTLIMLGTNDHLVPVKMMEDFCSQLTDVEVPCRLELFEGATHGFFNKEPHLSNTIADMEGFLQNQGFISE